MLIEALGNNIDDLVIIDGNNMVIGSIRCTSTISDDLLMALATDEERSILIAESKSAVAMLIGTLRLEFGYLSDDVLVKVLLALEVYARKQGYISISLCASEIAAKSIYEDLGYQHKAYLHSLNMQLLEKNLILN